MATVEQLTIFRNQRIGEEDRTYKIGDFFAQLTAYLLGGDINQRQKCGDPHRFDVVQWRWGVRLETKGSSNGQNPFLYLSQLENAREAGGEFFGRHFWYAFFFYKNRLHTKNKWITQISRLSRTTKRLRRFLGDNTRLLCVIDIRAIEAFVHAGRVTERGHDGKPQPAVLINETMLKRFAQEPHQSLSELGLNSGMLTVQTYRTMGRFGDVAMNFSVVQVLPPRFHDRVKKGLSRRFQVIRSA